MNHMMFYTVMQFLYMFLLATVRTAKFYLLVLKCKACVHWNKMYVSFFVGTKVYALIDKVSIYEGFNDL